MKTKIFFLSFFALLLSSLNANAGNCGEVAKKFEEMFNKMSALVKNCNSLDELENINFDNAIASVNMDNVDDDCLYATMTSSDKDIIRKSVMNFFDTFADRLSVMSGGLISKDEARGAFAEMKSQVNGAINSSKTYSDFFEAVNNLF